MIDLAEKITAVVIGSIGVVEILAMVFFEYAPSPRETAIMAALGLIIGASAKLNSTR